MNEIIQQALKVMESEFIERGDKINHSALVKDYCRLQLGSEKEEVFAVLYMDSNLRMLSFDKLFRGSIAESSVPPRAIARRLFELNASKMILVHNHPSGIVKPSDADIDITKNLSDLFAQLDCKVVDHIIVSEVDALSMAEKGLMRC